MPPINDNIVDATLIAGASGTTAGSNVGATVQTLEPASSSVWWKWVAPTSDKYFFSTRGGITNFRSNLNLFTNPFNLNAYNNLFSVPYVVDYRNGFVGIEFGALVAINAVAGTTYLIRVAARAATTGDITLSWGLYFPTEDGLCAGCPTEWGPTQTCKGFAQLQTSRTPRKESYGNFPAGIYKIRYCKGTFRWGGDGGSTHTVFAWDDNAHFNQIVALYSSGTTNFLGDWSSATAYVTGDLICSEHAVWRAISTNTNKLPSANPANWVRASFATFRNMSGIVKATTIAATEAAFRCAGTGFVHCGGEIALIFSDLPLADNANDPVLPQFALYASSVSFQASGASITRSSATALSGNFGVKNLTDIDISTLNATLLTTGRVTSSATIPFTINSNETKQTNPISFQTTDGETRLIATLRLSACSFQTDLVYDLTPILTCKLLPLPGSPGACNGLKYQMHFTVTNNGLGPTWALNATISITPAMVPCTGTLPATISLGSINPGATKDIFFDLKTKPVATPIVITVALTDGPVTHPTAQFAITFPAG